MIRINLLPVRAAKKKESARFQLTIAGLATFLVIAVTLLLYVSYLNDTAVLKKDIEASKVELAALKRKIGELTRLKEQKRVLENKLKIVTKLEQARKGPVEMFERLSAAMPEQAWLSMVVEKRNTLTLTGIAAYDDVIAKFMRNLQEQHFTHVQLVVAKRLKANSKRVTFTLKAGI